jgi:hypothetical protein
VTTERRLAPAESGPCHACGGDPTRTLGRFPYCDDCADERLTDIRARVLARDGIGHGVGVGRALPEYGPRHILLSCTVCGAGWVGRYGERCHWCQTALQRQLADQRAELLWPSWQASDAGAPRYDELSEVDRRVWDRTRGQGHGAGSRRAWCRRLAGAVRAGLVTFDEAEAAMRRAGEP